MFPERLRSVVSQVGSASWEGSKWLYHVGRIGIWVIASSATILALPVMFESERNQMEEQQIQQQRQVSVTATPSRVFFVFESLNVQFFDPLQTSSVLCVPLGLKQYRYHLKTLSVIQMYTKMK